MWAWYFFSFGISSKKFRDEPVHQKQLISSVWKLMTNPVGKVPWVQILRWPDAHRKFVKTNKPKSFVFVSIWRKKIIIFVVLDKKHKTPKKNCQIQCLIFMDLTFSKKLIHKSNFNIHKKLSRWLCYKIQSWHYFNFL